jgi:hypothetical protein
MKRDFEIDEGVRSLLPALTDEEREGLETQLRSQQHVDPLVILVLKDSGHRVLGDGHNRLEIADRLKLPYETRDVHVDDRLAAQKWVIDNQLSRRNVSEQQKSYLRGKELAAEKGPRGGSKRHDDALNEAEGKTAEKVAERHGVSPRTVERDEKFAAGVDALEPEAKAKVLKGEATATKVEVATGVFCKRCTRVGPIKDCLACKAARERAARPQMARRRKNTVLFDFPKLIKEIGAVLRGVDDVVEAYPEEKGRSDYRLVKQAGDHFFERFKTWGQRLAKVRADKLLEGGDE